MALLLKQLFNFFQLLHSENGTNQITWGLTLGLFLGLSPFFSLQTLLIFFILLIFRVQIGAAFLSAFFFKLVAYVTDPLADYLGQIVLTASPLKSLWTTLYNMPIVPYTRFNNSIVMGSFFASLVLSPIAFFFFKFLVLKYRSTLLVRLESTKIWKFYKATAFYNWYQKYNDLYGAQ